METNNQVSQPVTQPVVDYAAALRQYQKYGRGRSMKKFCFLRSEGQCIRANREGGYSEFVSRQGVQSI